MSKLDDFALAHKEASESVAQIFHVNISQILVEALEFYANKSHIKKDEDTSEVLMIEDGDIAAAALYRWGKFEADFCEDLIDV